MTVSKATSGPEQYLEALRRQPRARALPLSVGEGVGTGDHRYDAADVQCDDVVRQLGCGYTFALERTRCDRHQAIQFVAVSVRVVPARYRQQPAGLQRAVEVAPCLHGVKPVFRKRQTAGSRCSPGIDQRNLDQVVSIGRMVDVAAGFGIDQRHAGRTIEMAGEIGELVGENFEDRGIDLNSADVPGAEKQPGKNVTAAADSDDRDVGRRLHQIGGIDDVVLQVGELADIAVVAGDDGGRIRIDIEAVLFYFRLRRVGKAPTDRSGLAKRRHPHARVGIPAFEQRSQLLGPLGPEHAEMAFAGNIEPGMHDGRGSQRQAPRRRSGASCGCRRCLARPSSLRQQPGLRSPTWRSPDRRRAIRR